MLKHPKNKRFRRINKRSRYPDQTSRLDNLYTRLDILSSYLGCLFRCLSCFPENVNYSFVCFEILSKYIDCVTTSSAHPESRSDSLHHLYRNLDVLPDYKNHLTGCLVSLFGCLNCQSVYLERTPNYLFDPHSMQTVWQYRWYISFSGCTNSLLSRLQTDRSHNKIVRPVSYLW